MNLPMVNIVLDSRLRMRSEDLPHEVQMELERAHTYINPEHKKIKRLAASRPALRYRLKHIPEVLRSYANEGGVFSLPRGSLPRLRDSLRDAGLRWTIEDRRTEGSGELAFTQALVHRPDPSAPGGGELRWYQQEAVDAVVARQNCLLRSPTGSGKTTTGLAVVAQVLLPTLVIVPTKSILAEWQERAVAELGLAPDDVGQLAAGKRRLRPLTVAVVQTLTRNLPLPQALLKQFGLVICDEVQRFAADTFQRLVGDFPSKYRVGISADETRSDGKEFLIYDQFGAVAHSVTRDALVDEGAILDVQCRVLPTEFRAPWYTRQIAQNITPDTTRLVDELVAHEGRNSQIVDAVAADVQRGHQVIVMSQRVDHCRLLAHLLRGLGIRAGLMLGGAGATEVEMNATRLALKNREISVGVGTVQAIGTGTNLPSVGRGVLATPLGKNKQLYNQVRGRLCRLGKEDAALYVLWDQWVNGAGVLDVLARWNRAMFVADDGRWVDGRSFSKAWKEQRSNER